MKKFILLFALISSHSFASELCERVGEGLNSYLLETSSRISFRNQGGLMNGGVCWWHSRLQRSSAFLAEFQPEADKPSDAKVKAILRSLKLMNSTVVIPGYVDFYSFTRANFKLVQAFLESWQREDGFLNQEWIRGISGQYELPADEMKVRMDTLYSQFTKSLQPVWIMAQIKGITSHSFLLLEMNPIENGYELKLIDSNAPIQTKTTIYREGQRFLKNLSDSYSFVPYLGFQKDLVAIKKTIEKACGNILGVDDFIPMGEIEIQD